jgi:hypothetical protein
LSEQKNELVDQTVVGDLSNKYKLVIAAATEAKKVKGLDKEKTANLGKITMDALIKTVTKEHNKEKRKEKAEAEADEKE